MNRFHGRSFMAVALMLTASCDNPTGPSPDPDPIVQPDDVTVVVKLRVIPSQEARSRPHFSNLQIRIGNDVYSATADGTIKIVRSKNDPAVVLHLQTKVGVEPFFCGAKTSQPVRLSGDIVWDVLPTSFVVQHGKYEGHASPQNSCERVKNSCEVHPGQDGTFYPAIFCEESPTESMPLVYRFPIPLHFDSGDLPVNVFDVAWEILRKNMENFGNREWFTRSSSGVRVFLDSDPACSAIPSEVVDGKVLKGTLRCRLATYTNSQQYSPTRFLESSIEHEGVHLLGLRHKCGEPTIMTAPGCGNLRESTTLLDVVDVSIWVESLELALSEQKSNLGLREVLAATRAN